MFSKFFIDRPVLSSVLSLIIVICGLISLFSLPLQEYPKIAPVSVSVSAYYRGADAQNTSNAIASILEKQLNGVENLVSIQSSSSSDGSVGVFLQFKQGTNPDKASLEVNNRVQLATRALPQEVVQNGIFVTKSGGNASILEVIAFISEDKNTNQIEQYNYVLSNIADEIKRVSGVSNVNVIGNKEYAMRIWLNPDTMSNLNIGINEVINAINIQNRQYTIGQIGQQPNNSNNPYVFSVNPEGRLKSVEDFKNIIIRSNQENIIRLKDVAQVEIGANNYSFSSYLNNKPMTAMMIFLQNGANALQTAKLVSKKLDELSKNYPPNFRHVIAYDTTKFVEISIKEVLKTFAEAMILVMIVIYLFLRSFRAALVPMIAVPVSIIGTFAGFYLLGFSINLITLFALVLAIGIVVDDAIIVVENVERIMHEEPNLSTKQACIKAMQEVSTPLISIVLVLGAVFIPVSFQNGLVGIVQREFALTLVISVAISGFVALTLSPALCVLFLKKNSKTFYLVKKFNDFFDYLTKCFAWGINKVLKRFIISFFISLIFIYSGYVIFKLLPYSLAPQEDKGIFIAANSLTPASSIKRTIEENKNITSKILENKNIENVINLSGYNLFGGGLKEDSAVDFISLKDYKDRNQSVYEILEPVNAILQSRKESQGFAFNVPAISGLSISGGFSFYLQNKNGKSYKEIVQDANLFIQKAMQIPELTRLRVDVDQDYPFYKIDIDLQKASILGISKAEIYEYLSIFLNGRYINDFNLFGKSYGVHIKAQDSFRSKEEDIKKIFIKNKDGLDISLGSLVKLQKSAGPDSVDRFNLFPAVQISGQPNKGYSTGDALKAVNKIFEENFNPDEYSLAYSGSTLEEINSKKQGLIAFALGIVFVFLILAAQYEKWILPLAVISAVPFAVFGSVLATYLRGLDNDLYFQIGLLLLIGLSAKNAILIIEYAVNKRKEGLSIKDSALQAAKIRFRPIIMTSLAFAIGVLPMFLSQGAGSGARHSISTGLIGGITAASTIALFFVPLFYYLIESLVSKVKK